LQLLNVGLVIEDLLEYGLRLVRDEHARLAHEVEPDVIVLLESLA
jgi:hypothetical protein